MRTRRQTATASAEIMRLPDQLEDDMRQRPAIRVVQADNAASPVRWVALAFFVLGLPVVILVAAIWDLTGIPRGGAGILGAFLLAIVGLLVLIVGNGDFPAWREIARSAKNEERRMAYLAALWNKKLDHENQEAKWTHEERMKELDSNANFAEIFARLRLIEDRNHVSRHALSADAAVSPGYTPAKTDGARQMAAKYILGTIEEPGLYSGGGLPHPRKVTSEGRIVHRVPWSKRGDWKDKQAVDGLDVLQNPAPGAAPMVLEERTEDGRVTGWYLNLEKYPTKGDAIRVLGAI